jgi:hypothetical protein
MKKVTDASALTDIARTVPYLVFFSDYGPDFERHCTRECQAFRRLKRYGVEEIQEYRKNKGEYKHELTLETARAFLRAERFALHSHFCQFVVCSMGHFPKLIDRIKRVTTAAVNSITTKRDPFIP